MDLRKAWGPNRNKRDIDIIHIGLYHLKNGILDIAMSFQFMQLWTGFNDLRKKRILKKFDSRER
jgi:hypothetical protein